MAERFTFRVEGLSRVVRDLRALGLDVDDLKGSFGQIASLGAARVAAHVPRRSGRLAASVRATRLRNRVVVTVRAPYAGVINYGWPARRIRAAGFTEKADEELRPRALQLLENEINTNIRKRNLS